MSLLFQLWYYYWMASRALLLHFETLGAIGVFATTLIAIFGYVNAGLAGGCITSAVSFNVSIYWASRFWTLLELDLKYVTRNFGATASNTYPQCCRKNSRIHRVTIGGTSCNRESQTSRILAIFKRLQRSYRCR